MANIGERLRDERTRRGISQRELAKRLDLSPSLISQIETGRSKPSVGTLYAIVTELRLSVDRLFEGSPYTIAIHRSVALFERITQPARSPR